MASTLVATGVMPSNQGTSIAHDISLPLELLPQQPGLNSLSPAQQLVAHERVASAVSPSRLRPPGVLPRPLSNTRGRSPAEDGVLSRAPSRTKTPAGRRRVNRFLNDNLVSVAAILGTTHSAEELAATLEHLTLKISHRSFVEPLLADRELLRTFRRGEVSTAQPPSRQHRGDASAPETVAGVLREAYQRLPRWIKPLMLAEARRDAAGRGCDAATRPGASNAEPTLLIGLELVAMMLIDGSLDKPVEGKQLQQLFGYELSGSVTDITVGGSDAAPSLLITFDDSYSRQLLMGVAAFYGLQLHREQTPQDSQISPGPGAHDSSDIADAAQPSRNRGRMMTLSRAAGSKGSSLYARLNAVRRALAASADERCELPEARTPLPNASAAAVESTAATTNKAASAKLQAALEESPAHVHALVQGLASLELAGGSGAPPDTVPSQADVAQHRSVTPRRALHCVPLLPVSSHSSDVVGANADLATSAPPLIPLFTLYARSLGI